MTAQELKNAILQLAVQGKLVPQNPDDEPAEILLQRILAEKKKLAREGRIKKEKPLPPIDEEEIPFEIPDSWVWVRFNSITENIGDGIHGTPEFDPVGDYYFINGNNLVNGKIVFKDTTKKVSRKEYELYRKPLNSNTILLSINGTIGNIAYYNNEPIILGKSACYIALLNNVNKDYIRLLLGTMLFLDYAVNKATRTTIANVSLKAMRMFPIPLPPLEEQKRIVAKIEELLPLVEQYGAAEEELQRLNAEFPEQLRKSILQQAVQGKLVPQNPADGAAEELLKKIRKEKDKLVREGKIKKEKPLPEITEDEIPFEIPESWAWVRLGDCNNIYTGNSINASVKQEKYSRPCNGYNFIATKDVGFDNKINYQNGIEIPKHEPNFRIAPDGSALLCIEGGSAGRKIGLLNQDVCFGNKLCCFTSIAIFNKFVYYFLQSYAFFSEFTDSVSGIIGGVSIAKIKNLLLPLPPLAEQKRIVEKIESLLPLCDALKQQ